MAAKFPPPPQLPKELGALGQQLNRWLIEIQSILNSGGAIDPDQIAGLPALFLQVAAQALQIAANTLNIATNTTNIATNTTNIATNTTNITTLQGQVTTLQGQVTTLQGQVTTLLARNQVLHGNGVPAPGLGINGDLYSDDAGSAGANLYSKRGGAWVAIA